MEKNGGYVTNGGDEDEVRRGGSSSKATVTYDCEDPRLVIPHLVKKFYKLGWMYGTGGAISIRDGDNLYVSPSGVQKEYVTGKDIFVYSLSLSSTISKPTNEKLRISSCLPHFINACRLRDAGGIIHSHSIHAVLITLINDGKNEIKISNYHMIRGIKNASTGINHHYQDTLTIPIIENAEEEEGLKGDLAKAMTSYPDSSCVLIRGHGIHVYAKTWQSAKAMAETYDYLFELIIEKHKLGITI